LSAKFLGSAARRGKTENYPEMEGRFEELSS